MSRSKVAAAAIFGASDGLVACTGLVLAESARGRAAVLAAAVGLLIAEGLGMAASEWLADDEMSLRQAGVMGAATALPIVLVALPWLVATGTAAVAASLVVAVGLAGSVAYQRRGGVAGWAQTYGVLAGVAVLAWLGGML